MYFVLGLLFDLCLLVRDAVHRICMGGNSSVFVSTKPSSLASIMKTHDEVIQYAKGMLADAKKFALYLEKRGKQMGDEAGRGNIELAAIQGKIGAFEDMLNFLEVAE